MINSQCIGIKYDYFVNIEGKDVISRQWLIDINSNVSIDIPNEKSDNIEAGEDYSDYNHNEDTEDPRDVLLGMLLGTGGGGGEDFADTGGEVEKFSSFLMELGIKRELKLVTYEYMLRTL